ncbi:glutamate synthase large subunit [bacterium]|nr:MAG: glutamate synthase large subunit [bacterium]
MYQDPQERDACGVGFLSRLDAAPTHELVELALRAATAMAHRGARAADGRTGDGAGITLELSPSFFARDLAAANLRAPERLGVVTTFLPAEPFAAAQARAAIESRARGLGLTPLRWREVPRDARVLGAHALTAAPAVAQLLVDAGMPGERGMRNVHGTIEGAEIVSSSTLLVTYKALLSSEDLAAYYADLRDPAYASRFAVFHQRFSTNTAPSWRLVQPFRFVAHNGEINTLRGNRAWMRARGLKVDLTASDSFNFDEALEAMLRAGWSVDDAVDALLAPAPDRDDLALRAYYDARLAVVEPWDGPACIAFTDGLKVGAALDRSGFRPSRWCVTSDGYVICASETGVLDVAPERIVRRGRLGPGDRIVVDLATGELVEPSAFRARRRAEAGGHVAHLWRFVGGERRSQDADAESLCRAQVRSGWALEDHKDVLIPAARTGNEVIFAMGDDAAFSFLSRRQRPHTYLRQRFAQVTNPPIDPLREAVVCDARTFVGARPGFDGSARDANLVVLDRAVVHESELAALLVDGRLQSRTVRLGSQARTLREALADVVARAVKLARAGATLVVFDDRYVADEELTVPALLAVGALNAQLVNEGLRLRCSIAATDGMAFDSHSAAMLLAAGADVVCPWLALRTVRGEGLDEVRLAESMGASIKKVLAKLGICTLRSYIGGQAFDTLGLAREVVELCFPSAACRLPTIGFDELEQDLRAFREFSRGEKPALVDRGSFRFRREGLKRAYEPMVIKTLRASAIDGDEDSFYALSDEMEKREPRTVRDLFDVAPLGPSVPLESVESEEGIIARFTTSAMSLGSLSPEAHEAVAAGAHLAGARSNAGEGGEDPRHYRDRSPGAPYNAVRQVASARFGVTAEYLVTAEELEIKIAQGAKPGEGGQIPANKVTVEIATLRRAQAGQQLISPPPHHDIYSIEDLAQLIYDLRRVNPRARIAVKLVSQTGIGAVAAGVAKALADVIHVAGHDGGTGASPLASIKHAGSPWELGLLESHRVLVENGLRSRTRLRVDGGIKTGRDVVVGALLGAQEFGVGSTVLVAIGCVMARQCHLNTCPVGIATQKAELRAKFPGKAEHAANYLRLLARDVRRRLAALGARSLDDLMGRTDLVRPREGHSVDISELMGLPAPGAPATTLAPQSACLDDALAAEAIPAIEGRAAAYVALPITPGDRAVGARVSGLVAERFGERGLAVPLRATFRGTAGQSFGAFLTAGISLRLEGDANDYVGKGMSGGEIVIAPPWKMPWQPVAGNACFYGATGGRAFLRGSAGERFAVRNSGASLVVGGVGDHGCEYMTSGEVVILGPTGRNFASGMTGGVAYVLDAEGAFPARFAGTAVRATRLGGDPRRVERVRMLLEVHAERTESEMARTLLRAWPASAAAFWLVEPVAVRAPSELPEEALEGVSSVA